MGATNIFARDLGIMGETYPIAEVDFLEFIQSRIQSMQMSGEWKTIQNHIQQDAIRYRDRPKPVNDITRANETRTRLFNPTIVLDHDISSPEGKIIALAGTKINPLDYISLSKTLIFYDADDPEQVKWAISQDRKFKGKDKLVLVNGSILSQEKLFKKTIYFDQEGKLTARFTITHIPAFIIQEGAQLRITEVKL